MSANALQDFAAASSILQPASSIQHQHSSCPSVRCRLSRPHQVSCPLQTPSSQQIHTQHAGRWPSRPRGILPRLRPYQAQVRHPAILPLRRRLRTSARSARAFTQGVCRMERPTALRRERRAQLRQVSCQRTSCASSPLLNPSCTQAIAEVRPFAMRSRHRCAGDAPSSSASPSHSCTQADAPCRWSLLEDSSPAAPGSCGRLPARDTCITQGKR